MCSLEDHTKGHTCAKYRYTITKGNLVQLLCDLKFCPICTFGSLLQWLCSHGLESRSERHLDRDPKRDWDRDLNYMRSHALQTPSQSRSGSAYCEVIFCSYCAVHAD